MYQGFDWACVGVDLTSWGIAMAHVVTNIRVP